MARGARAALVPAARLELRSKSAEARELWLVASDLLDEAFCVLAADESLDGITEWLVGESESSTTA